MNLYPQDLRDRLHAKVISERAGGVEARISEAASANAPLPISQSRLSIMQRLWIRGLSFTNREATVALSIASGSLSTAQWAMPTAAALPVTILSIFCVWAAIPPNWMGIAELVAGWCAFSGISMTVLPRRVLRALYRPRLAVSEVNALLRLAHTNIDRAYVGLLCEVIKQPVPADAAPSLWQAVRALGRAVESLPPPPAPAQDMQALRLQARGTALLAQHEPDEIVAASLVRQSDALARRVQALERAAPTEQRTRALRAEVEAQIEALRAGLLDFRPGGVGIAPALLQALAEDARRVADQAARTAAARAELDAYVVAPTMESPAVQQARPQ